MSFGCRSSDDQCSAMIIERVFRRVTVHQGNRRTMIPINDRRAMFWVMSE
jgi:hypothetical protein